MKILIAMQTTIIQCQQCGARLRIPSDKHIVFTCPYCNHTTAAFYGTLVQKSQPTEQTSHKESGRRKGLLKRRLWITATMLLLITAGFFGYRWYDDHRDYTKFKQSNLIRDYYAYLKDHPRGFYKEAAQALRDDLWKKMIARYDSVSSVSSRDSTSVAFFRLMLDYMNRTDKVDIYIRFDSTIAVADFDGFDQQQEAFCRNYYSYQYDHLNRYEPPAVSNTAAIHKGFTSGKLDSLQSIIFTGLTRAFTALFGEDFIHLEPFSEGKADSRDVVIHINYNIHNADIKEGEITFPLIIPYVMDGTFVLNVPCISIDFSKSSIVVPEGKKSLCFGSVHHIDNKTYRVDPDEVLADAYGQFTRSCFRNFTNSFVIQFGLYDLEHFDAQAKRILRDLAVNHPCSSWGQQLLNEQGIPDEEQVSEIIEQLRNDYSIFINPDSLASDSALLFRAINREEQPYEETSAYESY